MEYYGYHVFSENYKDLTVEQALFLDYGLTKLYNDMYNSDEREVKQLNKYKNKSHVKRF